ncbi:1-acyl-sn-glycerol-3-phosphate acyltransferase [Limimonas halophila]|uniref:1-acyl-sn-glycerol-3-phosphate acyltransferase n=1 Tax=Limimonas halophila TaxID=1082479 RepID=A0A1G7TSL2_9PROT|nr:lysophospholipid acyltransferase family protein [Limimonas halophila]SDG38247.1 1-acyl-sn-glycerol-3-phosphate acyltransferase [Limimonas halophila]
MMRSLTFNVVGFAWTAFMMIACLPLLAAPRRWILAGGRVWIRVLFWLLRGIVGLGHEIRGRENLPDPPFLVAAKHQSAWDTLAFPLVFDDPAYILKRELTWSPPFGWYLLRHGAVPIDRAGGAASLRRMLRGARAVVDQGRPLIIYPEGTRRPPDAPGDYHPGVAALYRDLNLPVVPIALNSGVFWGRHAFRKQPGRIVMEIQPPIEPGLSRKAFMRRLTDSLEPATARLVREARGDKQAVSEQARAG